MKLGQKFSLTLTRFDQQLRGVAHEQGRTWFIEYGLPGERVEVRLDQLKPRVAFATTTRVIEPAAERQVPFCAHYGQCGGCSLQHLSAEQQIVAKQQGVLEQLKRIAGLVPNQLEPALVGQSQAYRRQARLALRQHKGAIHFGFRQAQSQDIVAIQQCPILEPVLESLLEPLRRWLEASVSAGCLGHIELLATDAQAAVLVRHNGNWSSVDRDSLQLLAEQLKVQLYEQAGDKPVQALTAGGLEYELLGVHLACQPGDFLQVQTELNRRMVGQALDWLNPQPSERGVDLFAGLGNFSVPLAARSAELVAVEVSAEMVQRLQQNARHNGLEQVRAYRADLMSEDWWQLPWARQSYDWVVLDPPRAGAEQLVKQIQRLKAKRLLYVSCDPATLARDLKLLAQSGFQLQRFGVIDMFPHTAHIESMALLVRK